MGIATATRLGPYEVLGPLGVGGMGEVYRATDTRLGRVVALKVLPEDFLEGKDRKERFEREARTLASLNHPNVATLYSFEEIPGSPSSPSRHVLTMELLEGESLREIVLRRTPTTRQVLSWALQAAQGLAAAHAKGIVHRDIKPENLFLTSDGRIKILDFGLAKLTARAPAETEAATASGPSTPGVIVGTVAYMSPEQIEAEGVDPRSDVFSLGVVLYELLAREHPFRRPTVPATLTAIVNETPLALSARLPEILPGVDRVIRKCLEKRRDERCQSAQELAGALEAVLEGGIRAAALTDVEEKSPYPGLSSFTEADAGRFFGREEEVEALWRKIHDRKLLAVIGPSGAGKTSFVRAGVVASRPDGWAAIVATPGGSPLRCLGQALAPHLASDPDVLRKLVTFEDSETAFELLSRWRRSNEEALIVVDQFEELFTLNPQETQERFASLLGRITNEANVHVVLSLRDDFLMRCHGFETLAPVFKELTPLGPMTRQGLRRALVEPATRRGYRFEDDALVDEMIGAVEGTRGELPLLAFAVSRLWEKRNAEKKVLTREAYADIGGVSGALARHAEETMERIGAAMEPTVREIFRNLTTAQGTRAVLDREELLSSLPNRDTAEAVLGKLIDARLLTSWETEATEGQPAHDRIEIVHESLLSAWPRLVRWQTQDADGAQLRDQLRQAAHLWEERGRADDLLWTGSSYLDYRVWRGRYPGKLSSLEEDFAGSMAALAERKSRRRRTAVGSVGVALVVIAGVMAVLWGRSQVARRRAEASKLLAMAQLRVDVEPSAALAYATKSVELDDTEAARLFALRLTQSAPIPSELAGANFPALSPSGEWLAVMQGDKVVLLNRDGREPVRFSPGEYPPGTFAPGEVATGTFIRLAFSPHGKSVSLCFRDEVRVFSVPDGREIRRVKYEKAGWMPERRGLAGRRDGNHVTVLVRPWDGGEERLIGVMDFPPGRVKVCYASDLLAYALGRKVFVRSTSRWDSPPRFVGENPGEVSELSLSEDGRRLAAADDTEEVRIWDTASTPGHPVRVIPAPAVKGALGVPGVWYSPSGRWVVGDTAGEGHAFLRLSDMAGPPGADPIVLRSGAYDLRYWTMDALGQVCAATTDAGDRVRFWPLPQRQPRLFSWRVGTLWRSGFTEDGNTLVAVAWAGNVRAWPLSADAAEPFRNLSKTNWYPGKISVSPSGREIVVASQRGRVQVIPLDGGDARELQGLPPRAFGCASVFSPDGRRVAAATSCEGPSKEKGIRVWDLQGGPAQILEAAPNTDDGEKGNVTGLAFVDREHIAAVVGGNGLMLFDLHDGKGKLLSPAVECSVAAFGRSGRGGACLDCDQKTGSCAILRFALDGSDPVRLPYRARIGVGGGAEVALDRSETVLASTGPEDSIQIGPVSGGAPHLIFGHKGDVHGLAFSPDGKWLASAGADQTIRLWPVPDVTKVPPHKRSKEEFLATLRTFTNVRAVADPKAPNGWKLEPGPFPGWQTPPQW